MTPGDRPEGFPGGAARVAVTRVRLAVMAVPDVSLGQVFGLLVLAGFVWLYVRHDLRRRPNLPCRRCDGSGKSRSLISRRFGDCSACGGSGKRRAMFTGGGS